jgi:hypothetical protein
MRRIACDVETARTFPPLTPALSRLRGEGELHAGFVLH